MILTLVSLDQHLSNLNISLALQQVSFALILNLNNLVLASLVLALVITGKGPAYMPDQHICMHVRNWYTHNHIAIQCHAGTHTAGPTSTPAALKLAIAMCAYKL